MGIFSKKIKPTIIGVCGKSCSGKSTVVKELEKKYKGDVLRINQDRFFKVTAENWERPEALRFDRLFYSVKKLKNGDSTHIPSEGWTEIFDREVKPAKIIIVEGFLLFVDKKLNKLFDKKIWVDVSDQNILWRRLLRDGNTEGAEYIMEKVIPESKKYEKIQRTEADIVIDGNKTKEEIMEEIEQYLSKWGRYE
jgi:uridine kinase